MNNTPIFYDGTGQLKTDTIQAKPLEITNEMRKNISGNPYVLK